MGIPTQITAMIRRTTAGYFTDVCTLEQEATTVDEYRSPIHQWKIVAENEPCRVISLGQRYGSGIATVGSAETMKREYRLIVATDVTLGVDMRVTVNGVQYSITRVEAHLTDAAFQQAIMQGRD